MKNSSRENNTLGSVDRISALPDSILGLILSNLRTKKAVATSLLSKRWKFVWRTVHNLDFRHEACWVVGGLVDKDNVMRFIRFVNSVLLHHDGGLLNKFRLVWRPYCILSHASSWISTAITRNVHELCVRVDILVEPYGIPEPFEMPMSVFSCASLQSLELNGGISLPDAIVVCLPRLETLKLVQVYFRSRKAFQKLISGCPMLNYLYLHIPSCDLGYFGQDGDFTYMISSTSLRRLSVKYCIRENEYGYYCSLVLDACSLEYFKLVGFMLDIAVRKCLSSLVEADLRVDMNESNLSQAYICESIIEAVRVFDCAKALTLSADVMWALSCGTRSQEMPLSTDFKRLVNLETTTNCCSCSSLQDFIQCSDNLEVLTIHKCLMNLDDENDHDHSNRTAPVEVPRCLLTSLKKVVLEGYYGYEDEREMIRYMLKHGSVLEVMQISCHRNKYRKKTKLLQEIREFTRKSPACEVIFSG